MSGNRSELRDGVESARLASGLRELRARTGLSLVALAARTAYSKSSWERYLNGKKLPPRDAVEALCRLAGEPAGRLVALWELADAAWSGRAAPGGTDTGRSDLVRSDAGPRKASRRPRPRLRPWLRRRGVPLAAGAGLGGLAIVAALALWAGEGRGQDPGGGGANAAPTPSVVTGCRGSACDGEDPYSMSCGVADLVEKLTERTTAGGRHIEIRYAEACGAAWGRLRSGRIGDRMEIVVPGVKPRSVRVKDRFDAEGYLVTSMAAAARGPQDILLCLYPADGAPRECVAGPG
ncbi:hypothetical protein SSP35_01_03230 [Streptomyces sp. NBRC 110611]|uniref:helix-turn-helix domain-containing protein n=1 Tax=Streptomyces sp. NBRC 110611 TaxID=1621259 RepID=UPI00082A4D23|nr:XRE family transcriptional regulator [Streptomyces sp. NBRC 110611]GAU64986.1 hypothetical protein SSP35_01_03230 [Streptomyces sp. NBRC 110611]